MSSSSAARHGPSRAGEAWFCTTGLPSDVVFEVQDMSFHLHKFPLMSKSRKISRMLAEQDEQRRPRRGSSGGNAEEHAAAETEIEEAEEEEDDGDEQQPQQVRMDDGKSYRITFPDFPGGLGTFETATKFCYGVRVELTPWNVAPLRCAAEYLEMTEEHSEDNLAARAEAYLSQSVLRHPGEATKALKSCEDLLPHAEDLGIVARCVGKLVDNYLAEVASDANLKPAKFCELALAMPDHARIYDDGVYRAVDIYLKCHDDVVPAVKDVLSQIKVLRLQPLVRNGWCDIAKELGSFYPDCFSWTRRGFLVVKGDAASAERMVAMRYLVLRLYNIAATAYSGQHG
ncbi:unnamed protein product [Triticum turgidum subsp. durum]|uniref:NPH3 domain-containing protein n=1 Tax=Triticum turgidum subsp. durum TaxID=4567 RepID=A0A9R0U0D6_TRITD|nr:unnamed protein product [Triticum turgidum subsp. durum]